MNRRLLAYLVRKGKCRIDAVEITNFDWMKAEDIFSLDQPMKQFHPIYQTTDLAVELLAAISFPIC